jgi:transcriptional regulator with XRE-family HTH domain
MKRKAQGPSQLAHLFLAMAEQLGVRSDRELAAIAGVSIETVANWRTGAVQELKPQKLAAIEAGLGARINALRERARTLGADPDSGLVPLEVEESSSPAELQRQLRERVHYDYLGHRFLYYDPQGALAWESLIGQGYEQDCWLEGVNGCARQWLNPARDARGGLKGPLAEALGFDRKGRARGLDVVSLGPGEGSKEVIVLERLVELERQCEQQLTWQTHALVDVSVSLLLRAATAAYRAVARYDLQHVHVLPFCGDFEEGSLAFAGRLPTSQGSDGLRLVLVLGNVFGNVRDEEVFVRQKLERLVRPGDLLWLEVGLRPDNLRDDPLYRLTESGREETASEAHRRLLLEGPYRRWEAGLGRTPTSLGMRVWIREDDDSSRVPGSCNFCHDLILEAERRALTMLYSRRYEVEGLTAWLEEHGYEVLRLARVSDSKKRPRVAHLLVRRSGG